MPKFRKKSVIIKAVRIDEPMNIEMNAGWINGHPGEWLITDVNGDKHFCPDSAFRDMYEPVDEVSRKAFEEELDDKKAS